MQTKSSAGNLQYTNVDEYINLFPEEVRIMLQTLRATILEEAPEAEETIKYQMPTYVYHGNLVYFGAYKEHIGFYPTPSVIDEFAAEVEKYKTGKGTLQFSLNEPLPLPLIRKVVQFRKQENLARKAQKRKTAK